MDQFYYKYWIKYVRKHVQAWSEILTSDKATIFQFTVRKARMTINLIDIFIVCKQQQYSLFNYETQYRFQIHFSRTRLRKQCNTFNLDKLIWQTIFFLQLLSIKTYIEILYFQDNIDRFRCQRTIRIWDKSLT